MGISEDKLKELILSKYKSIREYTNEINMPYSTLDSIFKRGIRKASVDNLIKICNSLNISADALVDGRIEKRESEISTVAAHFDGAEFTEEQLERIKAFAAFIKSEDK
ncbi:hypothetical protein BHF70_00610 [Anaerostipes sp. 494a]|uniref:helix-turn-helix domain-containing protein n=1 Tax=Anaerostipes sp. 494a TaxID=1261636 RepID=UPI0009533DF6|nr:helix-turn-helix transcriptional regulator [Anaerostipes sp. 494a]OLR58258.1 hypothetical protein BHF70_00610 [Anaerostipes sp. 494a]